MKKILLNSIAICIISSLSSALVAQPTLTASNSSFFSSDQYKEILTSGFNPGPVGPNQTWNFSSLSLKPDTTTWFGWGFPKNTSSFLNSNFSFRENYGGPNGENFWYYELTNAGINLVGKANATPFGINHFDYYSDPLQILRFPFTYQDTLIDNYKYTDSTQYVVTGNIIKVADAYGTLQTPTSSFTNVLRTKTTEVVIYTDLSQTSLVDTISYTKYHWYTPGVSWPLLTLIEYSDGVTSDSYGFFLEQYILNTKKDLGSFYNINLYPNPASEKATLNYDLKKATQVKITLHNMLGQQVAVLVNEEQAAGTKMQQLDMEKYPKGMYLVQMQLENQIITKRLIKQ